MKFHWWWIVLALPVVWLLAALVSAVITFAADPEATEEQKRKNSAERFVSLCFINWFFWPWYLPSALATRRLHKDVATGKRPTWIVLDKGKGEESGRHWTLSDGTDFAASADGGSSSRRSQISADYPQDDGLKGAVEYRLRKIAPEAGEPSGWAELLFKDRRRVEYRYSKSLRLPRGKYAVEFRVPNKTGKVEECSSILLIVAADEDYGL